VIYANIATKAKVVLIDRNTHKVTDWPLKNGKANYPMALDEADHRIFVVTRKPAQLVAIDTDSGVMVASVPCVNDADDIYYDTGRKRIYIPGGEASLPLSSKRMQTTTRHWQKFHQPLERAQACGTRNGTGSILLCPQVRKKVPPYGSMHPKTRRDDEQDSYNLVDCRGRSDCMQRKCIFARE